MEIGLQVEVIYIDNDLVKACVSASNGSFAGTADVYLGIGQLADLATQLQRFPKSISDVREFTLGSFDPEWAGGGIILKLYCADMAGHAYLEARIESDRDAAGRVQSAMLMMPVEANAVDLFVDELVSLETGKTARACLRATASGAKRNSRFG